MSYLTSEECFSLFSYDAVTGDLLWKERPLKLFSDSHWWKIWNTKNSGKVAGYRSRGRGRDAAIIVSVHDKNRCAHRIIWTMMKGLIPDGMVIDHIDGNPFNNRLENLRLATVAQNNVNRGAQKGSISGLKGAHFHKKTGKYISRITADGVHKHLGYFDTPEKANQVYAEAAKELHGEFAKSQ